MPTASELVGRLRARRENVWDGASQDYVWQEDALCLEAAVEIERLRAALTPFAGEVDRWVEMGDTRPIALDTDLTVADLRRARAALEPKP